jgi:glycosyltransferase involved in cell wall biosynthesis
MRIVVDMQGAQSTASRTRGIGRYTMSLSEALVRHRGEHEIILALSDLFPDTIEPIRAAFFNLLPQENIRVWDAPGPVDYVSAPPWRRKTAEQIREHFLADLKADVALISSLFEGLVDNAVTSIGSLSNEITKTVILYDLIPYIHRKHYLESPSVEAWYLEKVEHLRRADCILSISESSRRESIRYVEVDERSVVNISTAVSTQFSPRAISALRSSELNERYGLKRPLVMYTGGIDHRKNIEGLIRAYARLPENIRRQHQLGIVCSVQEHDRRRLINLAKQKGLKTHDMIITGFVPDEDLVDLYNLCKVFVFPSLHEGFGLPALEAMSCGAPVISSNTSSLPEVIGREDALFDPHNDQDISAKLCQVLTDQSFRQTLARHGLNRAKQFSWDATAKRALSALEDLQRGRQRRQPINSGVRPKLAYISPLPPERSGISDYSTELLPELGRHYEIEIVLAQEEVSDPYVKATFPIRTVEWFRKHGDEYDRVLYQFGNSSFHQHMFGLLREIPGVVVLHDFFMSGVLAYMDARGLAPRGWVSELYTSHGYSAVQRYWLTKGSSDVVYRYPCNLSVLRDAQGLIVHSANSLRLAKQWYGADLAKWSVIPLLRDTHISRDNLAARTALGFRSSDFLVCAFGLLDPSKLNQRLLQVWLKSRLVSDGNCHLVFVGENSDDDYGQQIVKTIRNNWAEENIRITGWVDRNAYQQYLAAADIAVQLRTLSRGETSAAVFDCMNHGLATIVNANGSMADLDDDAVWKLPDNFADVELIEALEKLWQDATLRKRLGARARKIILETHDPGICAAQYHEAIERFNASSTRGTRALVTTIAGIERTLDENELINIAQAIAQSFPLPFTARQLLVDISAIVANPANSMHHIARNVLGEWLMMGTAPGTRVEPVYATERAGYRYARRFTLDFLNSPRDLLEDDAVEFKTGDIFIGLAFHPDVVEAQRAFYQKLRRYGVQVYFVVFDEAGVPQHGRDGAAEIRMQWLDVLAESDGALCTSKAVADALGMWSKTNGANRKRPFKIEWVQPGIDNEHSMCKGGSSPDIAQALDDHFGLRVFRHT